VQKQISVLLVIVVILSLVLVSCSTSTTTTAPAATTVKPAATTPAAAPSSAAPAPSASTPAAATKPAAPSSVPSPSAGGPQTGGVLRMIITNSSSYIGDPTLILSDSNSMMGAIPDLEALVFSDNSGQIQPVLATSWTVAQDGKSITFNLRKGVKFHDGTDFNADAAKWNLDRYMAANPGNVPLWTGIDKVDDYTIKLNLKSFQNTLLNGLEGTAGMMVSPTAAQKNGIDWMKTNEAGTGPFKLSGFSRDVSQDYVRFDDYWGGKAYLDGVKFNVIKDSNTARMALESGGADVFLSQTDAITADLVKKGYILENRPGPMMSVMPDSKHDTSPFAKLAVRQALSYAIDREGMAKTLGYGYWETVTQSAAAYQFGHIDNSQVPYKYDPAKAKQLLASAGFPNGFTTSIIGSNTFGKDPILALQGNFKDVGITLNINMVESASWNNSVNKGWDGLLWGALGATDTNYSAFLERYFAATASRFPVLAKPNDLGDLITKSLTTPDYNTEKTICQQAVKLMVDDCTSIPVYITPANYLLAKNVHDTKFSNLGGSGFRWSPRTAWLSK
jgi:peptide/nickel transport system substrate-binding protein